MGKKNFKGFLNRNSNYIYYVTLFYVDQLNHDVKPKNVIFSKGADGFPGQDPM